MQILTDSEVTSDISELKIHSGKKKSLEELLQQMRTRQAMMPGTFARVFRDALMPSRISFTFRDRGFWAPSSMLVSIPKAAWGRQKGEVTHGGCKD